MKLPHPQRVALCNSLYEYLFRDLLGPQMYQELVTLLGQDRLTASVSAEISARGSEGRGLRKLALGLSKLGGSEFGNFFSVLIGFRNFLYPQPHFLIDDNLCAMLMATELSNDIPMSELELPYNRFYIEFGKLRNLPLYVFNNETGLHPLEGAYVECGQHALRPNERTFEIVFTGAPKKGSTLLDDATQSMMLLQETSQTTLEQALEASYQIGAEVAKEAGLNASNPRGLEYSKQCLNMLLKALLYMSMPACVKTPVLEKTNFLRATAQLKSTAKRNKAQRRAIQLLDYVLVKSSAADAPVAHQLRQQNEGRSVKMHWRRGHFRMQPYGEGRSQKKLVHIAPVLVNASQLGSGSFVEPPKYHVR